MAELNSNSKPQYRCLYATDANFLEKQMNSLHREGYIFLGQTVTSGDDGAPLGIVMMSRLSLEDRVERGTRI